MEYLQPAMQVLFILALVLVAALVFQPKSFVGQWLRLSELYTTSNNPRKISFPDEHILVGKGFDGMWSRRSEAAEFAKFDVELDEEGLWLLYDGPPPDKCSPRLFVPGTHVKYVKDNEQQYHFLIHADQPIQIRTDRELGEAIKRKLTAAPNPISLD